MYKYITHTKNDRILKSSTVFIKDDEGTTIGSICINEDITVSIDMEKQLHEKMCIRDSAKAIKTGCVLECRENLSTGTFLFTRIDWISPCFFASCKIRCALL